MNKYVKRAASIIVSACVCASVVSLIPLCSSVAFASMSLGNAKASEDITLVPSDSKALLLMDVGEQSPKGSPGDVITVLLPMAVNREYLPSDRYMLRNITIEPNIPKTGDLSKWPFDIINASYVRHLSDMSYNSTADVYYDFRISEFATKGVYPINFIVNATVWRKDVVNGTTVTEDVEFNLCVWVTVMDDGNLSGKTTDNAPIRLMETQREGTRTSPGKNITMHLPLQNYGGKLTDVTIQPVVTSDLNTFPFVGDVASYAKTFSEVAANGKFEIDYNFKVSPFATTGNKVITFRAAYTENGKPSECTFSSCLYVERGYEEIPTTVPPLAIAEYKLFVNETEVSGLMAGDDATLLLTIKNNDAEHTAYKNTATLTLPDTKTLSYTVGNSDSDYVSSLAPGKTGDFSYKLTVRRDAEVGIASVSVTTACETWDGVVGKTTQVLTIPISQPMDVVVDSPVIYGTPVLNSPITVGLNIVNMGRAKAINLQVMATDGLAMAESYYGGDLLAGGTLVTDVLVKPLKPGEYDGTLVVSYDDANGQHYKQELSVPLSVSVKAEDSDVADVAIKDNESTPLRWVPWVVFLLIILAVAAGFFRGTLQEIFGKIVRITKDFFAGSSHGNHGDDSNAGTGENNGKPDSNSNDNDL